MGAMNASTQPVCRICLAINKPLQSIFKTGDVMGIKMKISEVMMSCSSVQIYKGDGLTENVCAQCEQELFRAFKFKRLCETSDAALRKNLLLFAVQGDHSYSSCNDEGNNTEVKSEIKREREEVEDFEEVPPCDALEKPDLPSAVIQDRCDIKMEDSDKMDAGDKMEVANFPVQIKQERAEEIEAIEDKENAEIPTFVCEICNFISFEPVMHQDHMARHQDHMARHQDHMVRHQDHMARHQDLMTRQEVQPERIKVELSPDQVVAAIERPVRRRRTPQQPKPPMARCRVCKKTFTQKSSLKTHMRIHSRGKNEPFKCGMCDRRFASRQQLSGHVKMHAWPLKCEECYKTFLTKSLLSQHRKLHLDEAKLNLTPRRKGRAGPYECIMCEAGFDNIYELLKHKKTHVNFVNLENIE